MEILLVWLLFGIFSAIIANSKGRNVGGWFFCGLFFGPFGLLVALLPSVVNPVILKSGHITNDYSMRQTKACPFCAEPILLAAIKCKHCGSSVNTESPTLPENQSVTRSQISWPEKFGYRVGKRLRGLFV